MLHTGVCGRHLKEMDKCLRSTWSCVMHITFEHVSLFLLSHTLTCIKTFFINYIHTRNINSESNVCHVVVWPERGWLFKEILQQSILAISMVLQFNRYEAHVRAQQVFSGTIYETVFGSFLPTHFFVITKDTILGCFHYLEINQKRSAKC